MKVVYENIFTVVGYGHLGAEYRRGRSRLQAVGYVWSGIYSELNDRVVKICSVNPASE